MASLPEASLSVPVAASHTYTYISVHTASAVATLRYPGQKTNPRRRAGPTQPVYAHPFRWVHTLGVLQCTLVILWQGALYTMPPLPFKSVAERVCSRQPQQKLYIYIHTYTHTHTHVYTYTYIHTCIQTYVHIYIHTCMHTHIHIYTHTCIYTCINIYIHIYLNLCINNPLYSRSPGLTPEDEPSKPWPPSHLNTSLSVSVAASRSRSYTYV